jgi:hypothetical protein
MLNLSLELLQMAGVVGALDVVCNTWFGSKFEYIHGIVSAVTLLL